MRVMVYVMRAEMTRSSARTECTFAVNVEEIIDARCLLHWSRSSNSEREHVDREKGPDCRRKSGTYEEADVSIVSGRRERVCRKLENGWIIIQTTRKIESRELELARVRCEGSAWSENQG